MSSQAFDLQEAIYAVGDVASNPAAAAEQLRGVLARLEGNRDRPAPDLGPGGSSTVMPEVAPSAPAEPLPLAKLPARVAEVAKEAGELDGHDRQAALWDLAAELNSSFDEVARQGAPHLHPKPPAGDDRELAGLAEEITRAWTEGDSAAGYDLADRLNRSLDHHRDQYVQRQDDLMRRAQARRQPAGPAGR